MELMRLSLGKALCLTLLFLAVACDSDRTFNGSSKKSKTRSQPAENPPDAAEAQEEPKSDEVPTKASEPVTVQLAGSLSVSYKPIDIVFVVDTSPSMDDVKAALETSMGSFLSGFAQDQESEDFQVFLIGEDFSFPTGLDSDHFALINRKIFSFDSLTRFVDFLKGDYYTSTYTSSALRLRKDSVKEVVFVTDDDAARQDYHGDEIDGDTFQSQMNQYKSEYGDSFTFHGVVGVEQNCTGYWSKECDVDAIGQEYIDLADATGGLIQDITNPNWKELLGNLTDKIKQTNPSRFLPLEQEADSSKGILVKINGAEIDSGKYQYDQARKGLVFEADAAPKPTDQIDVTYYKLTN